MSSVVERPLMVCDRAEQSLPHGGPFKCFSVQPVLHSCCNKGCGMFCPVCGMVREKYPLLLSRKSSQ